MSIVHSGHLTIGKHLYWPLQIKLQWPISKSPVFSKKSPQYLIILCHHQWCDVPKTPLYTILNRTALFSVLVLNFACFEKWPLDGDSTVYEVKAPLIGIKTILRIIIVDIGFSIKLL